jgi:hypothetical protein
MKPLEITKKIGEDWQALDEEHQLPYKAAYEKEKRSWDARHPQETMWTFKHKKKHRD